MLRKIIVLATLTMGLSACGDMRSPQETTPSHEAQCGALRTQIAQAPIANTTNNTPSALSDSQLVDLQQQYHNKCE